MKVRPIGRASSLVVIPLVVVGMVGRKGRFSDEPPTAGLAFASRSATPDRVAHAVRAAIEAELPDVAVEEAAGQLMIDKRAEMSTLFSAVLSATERRRGTEGTFDVMTWLEVDGRVIPAAELIRLRSAVERGLLEADPKARIRPI